MSFPYEGPHDALRLRMRPPSHQHEPMEDLPIKQSIKDLREEEWEKPVVRKPRTTPKETWEKRKAPAEQKVKRVQASTVKRKPTSPLQGGGYKESQHPRDRFGRFAVKALKTTGKAIKSTAKGVGRAVKGTAKAVSKAHKSAKRVQSNARRRAALEHRERRLDLHKREQAAGLKRKKVVRKRVRR